MSAFVGKSGNLVFAPSFSDSDPPLTFMGRRPVLRRPERPQFGNSGDKIRQTVAVVRHMFERIVRRDVGSDAAPRFSQRTLFPLVRQATETTS
jgi:hypothetical protein